ncbi:unnamed protein product [Sphagnum troendelagicum]
MDTSGDNAWGLLYYHDVANPAWGSIPGYSLRTVHWRNALVDGDGGDECPCATTVYRCLYFVISMESILRSRIFQQQGVRFSKLLRIALAYEDRIWTHAGSSEEYGRIMSSLETFTRDTWNTFNLEEEEEEQQRQQLHILQHCDTNLHLLHEACDLSKSGNFPSFHELLAWWPLLPQPYRKLLEPWWTLQQFPASSSAAASCYSSFLPLSRPRPSQPGAAAAAAGASSRPALELIVLLAPTTTPLNLTPMIDLQAPSHVQQQLPLYPHNHVARRVQPIQNQELHRFSKMTTSHQQQQQQQHRDHQEEQQQQQEQQHHHHQQHQLPCTDAPPASCHHQNPSTGSSSSSSSSSSSPCPCPSSSSSDWHHQSRQNCSGLIFSSLQQQQFNRNSSGLISSSSGYCSYSSSSSSSSSMAFEQQGQQFGQRTLEGSLMDCDILACEIYMSLRHLVENGGGGGDDGVHPALPGPSLSLLRWGMITEGRVIDTMQYLLHQQQTN